MQKKNSKLESFLYRQLPDSKFERIRGYESCIVVSEKENKAFKYVILGDEWIYLTENPPKNIQEAVCLGDIISVDLVNDFPDFLMGDEKRNSQHLAISYWTSEPLKRRSLRKSKRSPRGSISDLLGDRSNASTPLSHISSQDVWSEDYLYTNQSLTSLQITRPDSRGSINSSRSRTGSISKKSKKKVKQLGTDSDELFLKSLKEELEEDILEDLEEGSIYGESMSRSHDAKNTQRSGVITARSARSSKATPRKSARPLPASPAPTQAFQEKSMKSVPPNAKTKKEPERNGVSNGDKRMDAEEHQKGCCGFCSIGIGKSKVSPLTCGSDKVRSPSDKHGLFSSSAVSQNSKSSKKNMSDVQIEIQSVSDAARHRRSSAQSSQTTLRGLSRSGTPAMEDDRKSYLGVGSDYGGSVNGLSSLGVDGPFALGEKRKAILNLYLLNNMSPMLMLIRSAWSNYLLTSTLQLSPIPLDTPKGTVVHTSPAQREKTDLLFQQLKRDLINPQNTMEDIYGFLIELRNATTKNFALKKLFWKNSEIFQFCVRQLQLYLPRSIHTHKGPAARMEEFEYVTIVIEILCLMFNESEIIPDRNKALKAERGRSVLDLLMVLTCSPDPLDKMSSTEKETEKVITDFTKTALAAVFELFLMAKQANWGFSEDNFLNISWMVRTLEEIKNTEKFVSRLITMMMQMISPNIVGPLSPEDTVLLYREFFILQIFLQYSPRIRTYICSTYLEEFKYFVQGPALSRKLPSYFPLAATTSKLIEAVMSKVLSSSNPTKSPRL